MKKLVSVILVLAMFLTMMPTGIISANAVQSGDFTYTVTDSKATITKYTGAGGAVTIPNELGGYPVTDVSFWVFEDFAALTGLTIGSYVTSIGTLSGCSGLTRITVDSSNSVFSSQNGVMFNKAKTSLLRYPPAKSGNYVIPNSVTGIADFSFNGCTKLTGVTIGTGVKSIGVSAFRDCKGLLKLVIPNNVTTIGDDSFVGCAGLAGVTIGTGVKSIGQDAFCGCPKLTSVTVPKSVTSIGEYVFGDCTGLTKINVDVNNTTYSSIDGVLFNKTKTKLLMCPQGKSGEYTVPNGTIEIGTESVCNCFKLSGLTISNSVKSIGDFAFANCRGLLKLTIGDGVNVIGTDAFLSCEGLTNVIVGKGVITVKEGAFSCCTKLQSIIFPEGVTSIGNWMFRGCTKLTNVTMPDSLTDLGAHAFQDCSSLLSLTIPHNMMTIGESAFSGCSKLKSITLAAGLTSIGAGWFRGFAGLTKIEIPSSVTGIETLAFSGCSGLTNITLPGTITKIASYAFQNCKGLTEITLPDKLETIEFYAFSGCTGLKCITFPNNVTNIGRSAFKDCSGLEAAYYLGNAPTSMGSAVFEGCAAPFPIYYLNGNRGFTETWNGYQTTIFDPNEPVTSISLASTNLKWAIGKTGSNAVTFLPHNVFNKAVSWSSSNKSVATVDSTGKIKAAAIGTATITCTALNGSNVQATCTITVGKPATSIKLNASSLFWTIGKSSTFKVTFTPIDAIDKAVSWTSNNLDVATIDSSGKAKAVGIGTAVITCTAKDGSNKKATCKITVLPGTPAGVTAVKASTTSIKLTWAEVSGITGYEVYRATSQTGSYTNVKSLTAATFTNTGLTKGKTYYYKIKAYKLLLGTTFRSAFSSIVSVKL